MTITLYVNRLLNQENNTIIENFTWKPSARSLIDDKYQGKYLLSYFINKMAIHNKGFKLLDIQYFLEKILYIYAYNYNIKDIQLSEYKIFEYYPTLKKHKCNNCDYYRICNTKEYCIIKGIQVNKNSHYRCQWWTESKRLIGGTRNLYNPRKSKGDDSHN